MSIIAEKFGVRLSKRHGNFIISPLRRDVNKSNTRLYHNSCQEVEYLEMKKLPLPSNMKFLPSSQKIVFSKEKSRDILGLYFAASSREKSVNLGGVNDSRIELYTNSGSASLNSSMQTNVPQPFTTNGHSTHLNMPRGQWRQEAKYISDQLLSLHHVNIRQPTSLVQFSRLLSSERKISEDETGKTGTAESENTRPLTNKQKLKIAVKEYGAVIVVLHISISLVSLGLCYIIIRSGFNLEDLMKEYGLTDSIGAISSAGPFIVAYAVHKVFAPLRIGFTLITAPVLVKFLRKRGFKLSRKK